MSIGGILLGLVNIGIVIAVLVLVGLLVQWLLASLAQIVIPPDIVKVYMVIVALIAIYMIIALLLGLPSVRIISMPGESLGFLLAHRTSVGVADAL